MVGLLGKHEMKYVEKEEKYSHICKVGNEPYFSLMLVQWSRRIMVKTGRKFPLRAEVDKNRTMIKTIRIEL